MTKYIWLTLVVLLFAASVYSFFVTEKVDYAGYFMALAAMNYTTYAIAKAEDEK